MSARSWVIAVKSAGSDGGHAAGGVFVSGLSSALAPQPANITTAIALARIAGSFFIRIATLLLDTYICMRAVPKKQERRISAPLLFLQAVYQISLALTRRHQVYKM
jgi:hypothetical protein